MAYLESLVENAQGAVERALMVVGELVTHMERKEHGDLGATRHVEGTLYAAHNLLGDLAPLILENVEEDEEDEEEEEG
ncbi:hypothetical protein ASG43_21510 [Aureimonas sp. Leaf454]|uniref:hypothetical protein n=1 Tax=Aureimonas sp. Leaf454 TaxID=1736381 RepID=UPI0006FB86B3|nr:hypothetical protein [Aureimonas sp. Leaf454]KQT51185.1 hypothetical protein ASG43_21510 [Aureimonas sp. Leaf454]